MKNKYIKSFDKYNESIDIDYKDLISLAKKYDYDTFLNKTDSLVLKYNFLYRGMSEGDDLGNDCFMTDYIGHAREYGEYVDGIIINEKVMYFDNNKFNELRYENFAQLLLPNIDTDSRYFSYDDYEDEMKNNLKEIYKPYFDMGKLGDAMYQLDYEEDGVINFVYDLLVNSTENYKKYSMNKQNDFLVPLLTYYAKSKGINIISFYGSDYGGADEFVVNDITRYTKLSDMWKSANKKKANKVH